MIRWPDGRVPVLLSAHAAELLGADARALLDFLDRDRTATVAAIADRLAAVRRVRRHRALIRARDRAELAEALRAVAAGAEHPLLTRSGEGTGGRTAFVFPGQGSQWPGMGAQAYRDLPAYRAAADACAAAFTAAGAPSPLRYLTGAGAAESDFTETEIEAAQFTHAVALAGLWRAHGVRPGLTVGHSLGEVGAAYVAGAMSLADAVRVVLARAGVVDRLSGRYAVAVLGTDPDTAGRLIAETPGWLELSVINGPASVAVSGDRAAVAAAVARVRDRGGFARELTVGFPVHTSILEPLRDELLQRLPRGGFAAAPVPFIGAATGDTVGAGTEFGPYWYANLRNPVRFDRAFAAAVQRGGRIFVELSAHPALLFSMTTLLGDTPATLVGTGRRDTDLAEAFSANLAAAAVADPEYRWRDLAGAEPVVLHGFPNAPMRATPMWAARTTRPAAPDPTVAHEVWSAAAPTTAPAGPVPVAVLDLDPADGAGAALRAAVAAHPAAVAADPAAAEVLVVAAPTAPAVDPPAAVDRLTRLVGAGALRYPAAAGPHCRSVWLVTAGAEQTRPGEPLHPVAAALAAAHRSLGLEHPELSFGHLDLPGPQPDPVAVDVLLGAAGDYALRRDGLLRRGFAEAAVPAGPIPPGLLEDVVITGAAGAVGRHVARELAARGARRIVLLSRRHADPPEPTGAGTEFVAVPCDITDPAALAEAARRYGGPGATLVVHAAGAAVFDTADRLDADAVANTLAAKVIGLHRLAETWPLRPGARIVACSSVSGLWGGRGHAGYAAANRMLDAVTAGLRAAGHDAVAVRWGLWPADGSGIVDRAEAARIERAGLRPLPPGAAVTAALRPHPVDPLVYTADAARLGVLLGRSRHGAHHDTHHDGTAPAADTAAAVRAELAAVLGLPDPAAIAPDAALFDLGIDSLLAIDLRKRLRRTLGRTAPLAALLGGITVAELIADLDDIPVPGTESGSRP